MKSKNTDTSKILMTKKFGKDLKGKTIGVFGASSKIGGKFTQEAALRGATVIAFARDIDKAASFIEKATRGRIKVVGGDITHWDDVEKVFRARKIYATVNFVTNASTDISRAKAVNILGEQYVLDASCRFGVKRHIYISTIATLMTKANIYRDTKLAAEKDVKAAKGKIEWIILRYTHVLGSRAWGQVFKIVIPYLRLGVPKIPTDANNTVFPYATIETVVEATLSSLVARPNQTIIVFDGRITLGEFLSAMEKVYNVRVSFLSGKLIKFLAQYFGKYFPFIEGLSDGIEFMTHPPEIENETMKRELGVKTRPFHEWIKTHFS